MDNDVKRLQCAQELQDYVISYRKKISVLKNVMKQSYTQELQHLVNVEVQILQPELKIPYHETSTQKLYAHQIIDANEIRKMTDDCNNFLQAKEMLA